MFLKLCVIIMNKWRNWKLDVNVGLVKATLDHRKTELCRGCRLVLGSVSYLVEGCFAGNSAMNTFMKVSCFV